MKAVLSSLMDRTILLLMGTLSDEIYSADVCHIYAGVYGTSVNARASILAIEALSRLSRMLSPKIYLNERV